MNDLFRREYGYVYSSLQNLETVENSVKYDGGADEKQKNC